MCVKVMVVLLNWAAPSLWPAVSQKVQANMMGSVLCAPGRLAIGGVVMPTYSHKKGSMVHMEEAAAKALQNNNLNLDGMFFLPFNGRTDQRELRLAMC